MRFFVWIGEDEMKSLLYYPGFEIQDENFLKFALLYLDEIRPIIPACVNKNMLNDSMKQILQDTDLIYPYEPTYNDGFVASVLAISYLEHMNYKNIRNPINRGIRSNVEVQNYTLYSDKYIHEFETFCLKNDLGRECNEGICVSSNIAYIYMSILADVISRENEMETITDFEQYADPLLSRPIRYKENIKKINTLRREIQFHMPVDMRRIPLDNFIKLRTDEKFNVARKSFVKELNKVLDRKDVDLNSIDFYDYLECKKELFGLIENVFVFCAALAVGIQSFESICVKPNNTLHFWGGIGNIALSAAELRHRTLEIKEYIEGLEGKKQARRYLAKIKQFGIGNL